MCQVPDAVLSRDPAGSVSTISLPAHPSAAAFGQFVTATCMNTQVGRTTTSICTEVLR